MGLMRSQVPNSTSSVSGVTKNSGPWDKYPCRALPPLFLPSLPCPLPRSRYKGERRKGRGRKGLGIGKGDWDKREGPDGVGRDGKERERYGKGRMGKGREGASKGERVGKGEGELDMDICPRAPSS